jgi:putative hemolysin
MRELPTPPMPLSDLRAPLPPWGLLHRRLANELGLQDQVRAEPLAFKVIWRRDEDDVRQAQQLNYSVFAEEMGAHLRTPPGCIAKYDVDMFAPICEHLLVRAKTSRGPGPLIGTYRVLTSAAAKPVGGPYAEIEFDLTRLRPLHSKMVGLRRAFIPTGARAASSWPCGARWASSWCATSLTPW